MATATLIPSGYTGLTGMTINSSYPIGNGYANSSSTNYTRFDISTSTTGHVYFTFDTSSIPSGATISSVTAQFKARVNNTSRVSSTGAQLYTGTTAKGSSTAFASTTASVRSITAGTWTRSELSNLRLYITGRGSSSTSSKRIDFYGADITVTYTAETVHPTSVTISPSTVTIGAGETEQLTETVLPDNTSDKSVTWSSNNTSVATVSSTGLITAITAGNATITVTTVDGNKTATCTVTVTPAVTYTYKLATSMEVGKKYLIANGNSGSVYLLTNESGGSRQLVGAAASVNNNRITITGAVKAKAEFECVRYTSGNDVTITVQSDNKYLYTDNASGLRLESTSSLNRFWHYQDNKFWQFKSTSNNGYTDTSSEYKYYLELNSSNNYTDNHVTSPSIADSTLPAMYIYVEDDGSSSDESKIYLKINGTWTQYSKIYKKVNGSWVEQNSSTWDTLFDTNTNYRKMN